MFFSCAKNSFLFILTGQGVRGVSPEMRNRQVNRDWGSDESEDRGSEEGGDWGSNEGGDWDQME